MEKRKHNKHFVIYYSKDLGTYVTTEPRPWARANKHLFPTFNFVLREPSTEEDVQLLETDYNFKTEVYSNEKGAVHINLNPELTIG